MAKRINREGEVYGRLTVVRPAPHEKGKKTRYLCKCSCGNPELINVQTTNLTNGNTRSCGCLQIKHGQRIGSAYHSPEYAAWTNIYPRPLAWDDYEVFLADVGPRPTNNHTLSKHDYRLDHGPDNTVWRDRKSERDAATPQPAIAIDLRKL